MLIYILLADGFEESEAIVPADILMRAGGNVKFVSITDELVVTGVHNIKITADMTIDAADKEEMGCLILPGGTRGAEGIDQSVKAQGMITAAVKKGVYIGAICAAPFILGKRGLLDGRRAACYPTFKEHLANSIFTGKKVEFDDIFITAQGMGVSFEFGYKLAEVLFGIKKVEEIKEAIQA